GSTSPASKRPRVTTLTWRESQGAPPGFLLAPPLRRSVRCCGAPARTPLSPPQVPEQAEGAGDDEPEGGGLGDRAKRGEELVAVEVGGHTDPLVGPERQRSEG